MMQFTAAPSGSDDGPKRGRERAREEKRRESSAKVSANADEENSSQEKAFSMARKPEMKNSQKFVPLISFSSFITK